jgi:hypothetical protein
MQLGLLSAWQGSMGLISLVVPGGSPGPTRTIPGVPSRPLFKLVALEMHKRWKKAPEE